MTPRRIKATILIKESSFAGRAALPLHGGKPLAWANFSAVAISPAGWTPPLAATSAPRPATFTGPAAAPAEASAPAPRDGAQLSGAPSSSWKTRSGVLRETTGEQVRIELPNGFSIEHSQGGPLALDGSGRQYPVQIRKDDAGDIAEYRFQTPQGSVRLDAADLTLTMKNPADTVTQSVDAAGRHVIQCQSCYRDPSGKMSDLVQSVSVEPDGHIRNLSRREGVEVSQTRLSFRNPLGLKLNFDLPLPVAQIPPAAAPPPPAKPVASTPFAPLFMES